jgi:S-adenosylmethionine-diacylglycerol 3-amino-3-carboxypropyl transferase
MKTSEIQHRADFSTIRYAQCWEDSLLLVTALEPRGRRCLSIGSAGDNSFALLAAGAESVTAVEMNPAQIACIELRRAAYLTLDHAAFLELHGSRPSHRRPELYQQCRPLLTPEIAAFWDAKPEAISSGIGGAGKFENYFRLFRRRVLPLAHPLRRVHSLIQQHRPATERRDFYDRIWNNRRWRAIFHVFFSRTLMGALGRDPEFFRYVEGSVADRILSRTRHALVTLDPSANPYLHWILTGTHGADLPYSLEKSRYETIRTALQQGRFRVVNSPIEDLLESEPSARFDAYNLSDIFEYMSDASTETLLRRLVSSSSKGARLAYWNMLAPRSRPASMSDLLEPLEDLAQSCFAQDRAFFYSRFVVEEVKG